MYATFVSVLLNLLQLHTLFVFCLSVFLCLIRSFSNLLFRWRKLTGEQEENFDNSFSLLYIVENKLNVVIVQHNRMFSRTHLVVKVNIRCSAHPSPLYVVLQADTNHGYCQNLNDCYHRM